MSARLPGYYIFKSVLPCLISLFAQTSTVVFSSPRWKLTPGFIYRSQRRLIFLFPRRFIEPDFRRSLSFSMQSRLIPGSLFGLRHGEASLFTLPPFYSSLFSFLSPKKVLITRGTAFIFVYLFLNTTEIIWVQVFLFKVFTFGTNWWCNWQLCLLFVIWYY